MVPLLENLTLVEYFMDLHYHHVLVSSPRLGSLNHTLSALEILNSRQIQLNGIIYNRYVETSEVITADSKKTIANYLTKYGHASNIIDIFGYDENNEREITDFSKIVDSVLTRPMGEI